MQTDPKNCGKCANVCASGICTAGVCRPVKDCYQKTTLGSPVLVNFDTYDGTNPVTNWVFAYNAAAGATNAVYAGFYEYDDGTGTPLVSMPASGANASKYAISISNTQASGWGGALGMWTGCIDASAYQGISFWVQGTTPTGKASLSFSNPETTVPDTTGYGGGTCSGICKSPYIDFPVTTTWTQILVPWSTFTPGIANGANVTSTGNGISGLTFNVSLNYVAAPGDAGYVASPGAYNLAIDDIQFIGNAACTTGLTICGTGCVNTQTNNVHCGACGNACSATRSCQAGKCICPATYTDCSGECVDTKIDVQNCGGCGKPCTGICSAGSCQASTCTSGMTQLDYTRTNYASITQNKYWINNNLWGISGATGWQGIWDTCTSGNTIGWGTDWNWSGASNQVKSYASAILGWHWGWKISGTGLPVQISANKNVTCGWTYRVTPGQTIDVAYDLFAHNSTNPGYADQPTDEIMIWLYKVGGAGPIGGVDSTASIGGASWEVHKGSTGVWNVYSYVRTVNTTSATLNMMDFLKDLVNKGWMSSSKYLTSIQAGTEVFVGTGRLDTDNYYCTIQ
jgi:Glycosyl hydrolase family 12.